MPSADRVHYFPDNAAPATPIDQMTEDECRAELIRIRIILRAVTKDIKDNMELDTDQESSADLGRELFHFKKRQCLVGAQLKKVNPNTAAEVAAGEITFDGSRMNIPI